MSELNATLQNQYKNTNIETFLKSIHAVIQKHTDELVEYLRDSVLNIDTASDIGLDMWGRLLGIPRYLQIPDATEEINSFKFNFNSKDFYKLQFNEVKENFTYMRLEDYNYRFLLKGLLLKNISTCTIENINSIISFLFSQIGGDVFIKDSEDMEFVTYVFKTEIPDWLKQLFITYDFLPRPAGVGFRIIESVSYYIGFKGQSTFKQTGKTDFTNFYKAFFKAVDLQQTLENKIKNYKPKQYTLYTTGIQNIYINSNIINNQIKQGIITKSLDTQNIYINSNIINNSLDLTSRIILNQE